MALNGMVARATGGLDQSPGPGAYGFHSTMGDAPKYTIKGRHNLATKGNDAPYRGLPSTMGEGPKYSLASRPKAKENDTTPGPNYVPPPLGVDAQKTSMSYRHGESRDSRYDNPGPGAYNIQPKFANDAQKSTLHGRTGTDRVNDSPGPAAYLPNLDATKKRAPAVSMHVRPQDRAVDVTPGPSDYAISRDLGGTKVAFHSRPKDSVADNTPGPGAYSPSDKTLGNAPKYTMKGRHEQTEKPNAAPYRALPSYVGEGPKISMASRHKVRDVENTPGPNYVPPPLGADAQKTSMSYRHGESRDSRYDNPGPGAYNIQSKFANDAQKSTLHGRTGTDRVNDSPGPAAYTPNIDATKKKAPSVSMHVRPQDRATDVTPGPSDYAISRDLGGTKVAFHSRPKDSVADNTPGPGAYSPSDKTLGNAPKYTMKGRHEQTEKPNAAPYRALPSSVGEGPKISMSSRHKVRDVENTPGPNYVPPPLGADAQKTSMSYRHGESRDSRYDNPGPGAYNIQSKFANDAQKSTLHGRTGTDRVNDSPGPAAYTPNIDATKKKAPSVSMHVRPQDRATDVTPGPSDYAISRDLGGTKVAFHSRPKDSVADNTPGPGAYSPSDKTLGNAPKYTMKGRHEQTEKPNAAPYRALPSSVGEGPKISMSSRHKVRDVENTPGPNYVPPPLGADAQKTSMSYRHGESRDSRYDNPGPGAYNIQSKFANDAQKSTLHGRTGTDRVNDSPGPAAYTPNIDATKKKAPSVSMHVRPQDRATDVTPGPSDYAISRDLGGTKVAFHSRPKDSVADNTPGPGAYSPSDKTLGNAPKYTMKGRHEQTEKPNAAPYRALPSSVGEGPKISMSSRHKVRDVENTPGPNYVPPPLGADAQKTSMSYRHGESRDSRYDNPGPGAYNIQSKFANDAQKSTLHGRTGTDRVNDSPGPAAYTPNIDATKKRAPASTMHIRPSVKGPEQTPGYYDIGSTLNRRGITIGRRETLDLIPC